MDCWQRCFQIALDGVNWDYNFGGTITNKWNQVVAYADDIVAITRDRKFSERQKG